MMSNKSMRFEHVFDINGLNIVVGQLEFPDRAFGCQILIKHVPVTHI